MGDSQPLEEPAEFPLIMGAPIVPDVAFVPLAIPPLSEVESSAFLLTAETEELLAPSGENKETNLSDPRVAAASGEVTAGPAAAPSYELTREQVLVALGTLASDGIMANATVLSEKLQEDKAAVEHVVAILQQEGLARPAIYAGWVELTSRGRAALGNTGCSAPRHDDVAGRSAVADSATPSANGNSSSVKRGFARWFFRKS